jgi:hypothetical protein
MRDPDAAGPLGDAWKVPMDRLRRWVAEHQDVIHSSSRGDFFDLWRDVWYVRSHVHADLELSVRWRAVVLRDLRGAPADVPRFYREAEWEVVVFECDRDYGTPPRNGDGLFEWDKQPPLLVYQFHGLSDRQVTALGSEKQPITFAQYVVEAMIRGMLREEGSEWAHHFSKLVNGIRVQGFGEEGRRALEVAPRTGLLVELEDGSSVSIPEEVTHGTH